jgi:hypothetical protein
MTTTTSQFTTKVQEYIVELEDDNYCVEDIMEFIEEYGEELFLSSYEEYVRCGEQIGYDAVDALMKYAPELLENCDDHYQGCYTSVADFAEDFTTNVYGANVPDYVVVDWTVTWDKNLSYDFINYSHFGAEYIFTNA